MYFNVKYSQKLTEILVSSTRYKDDERGVLRKKHSHSRAALSGSNVGVPALPRNTAQQLENAEPIVGIVYTNGQGDHKGRSYNYILIGQSIVAAGLP